MGLFFSKQKVSSSGIFNGFTDYHCHILPGVDDGFRKMKDSLGILEAYSAAGFSDVWLTPHIMEDVPNTTEDLRERFEDLVAAYKGNVKLHLASENMIDCLFEERLDSMDLLPLDDNRLLVETSCFNPPFNMKGILEKVRSKGFFPVLAHPERYMYMNMSEYKSLKDSGVLFQLNLPSLAGTYGDHVRKTAQKLLRKGMYDICGTDLHRASVFEYLMDARIKSKVLSALPR